MHDQPLDVLSPKNDYVFKRLFGDSAHIAALAGFILEVKEKP